MPEFLTNYNGLDLGNTQSGAPVGDVELPKWASSPEEFVRINREALESEHVSKNIHKWIDLIFGHKCRPPTVAGGSMAAVEACNVFFHLTYNDAHDLGRMKQEDADLYNTYVKQIECFGQAPSVLFSRGHPTRSELKKDSAVVWPLCSAVPGANTTSKGNLSMPDAINSWYLGRSSVSGVVCLAEKKDLDTLVSVDAEGGTGYHLFSTVDEDLFSPFRFATDDLGLAAVNLRHRKANLKSR
jgi:hypothetical protein